MERFKLHMIILSVIGVCLIFFSYGCTPPPTNEIADAEIALSAAREAGAERYAAQEYQSAESKLEEARIENESKRYKEAKDLAIEARDNALLAKSVAEEAKIKLREQARDALKTAKDALSASEMAGAEEYDSTGYRSIVELFAEADTAYSTEEFLISIQKSEEVTKRARRLELAAKRATELKQEEEIIEEEIPIAEPLETIYDHHLVEKGECLWIISEYDKIYGNPFKWPLIYRANRTQINDPDLIFPGQNFVIPRNPQLKEIEDAIETAKNRGPWSLIDGK